MQFTFYKPGTHTPPLLLPGQKRLDVFCHDTVKNTLFRMARPIFQGGFADIETLANQWRIFVGILPSLLKNPPMDRGVIDLAQLPATLTRHYD